MSGWGFLLSGFGLEIGPGSPSIHCSSNTTDFTYFVSFTMKNFMAFNNYLSSNFTIVVLKKNIKSTISESIKFKGSIYRILKSQKTISLAKISLTKQVNLIDLSCCDKHQLKAICSQTLHGTFPTPRSIKFSYWFTEKNINTPRIFSRIHIYEIWW